MTPQMGWVERASARAKPLQRLKLSAKHTTARRTCSITRPPTPEARAHNTNPAPPADSGAKARQLGETGAGERRARYAHLQERVDWAAQASALAVCMGRGGGRARALGAPALWLPERACSAALGVLHLREQHRGRLSRRQMARRWTAQAPGRVRVTGVRWMRLRERAGGGLQAYAALLHGRGGSVVARIQKLSIHASGK